MCVWICFIFLHQKNWFFIWFLLRSLIESFDKFLFLVWYVQIAHLRRYKICDWIGSNVILLTLHYAFLLSYRWSVICLFYTIVSIRFVVVRRFQFTWNLANTYLSFFDFFSENFFQISENTWTESDSSFLHFSLSKINEWIIDVFASISSLTDALDSDDANLVF